MDNQVHVFGDCGRRSRYSRRYVSPSKEPENCAKRQWLDTSFNRRGRQLNISSDNLPKFKETDFIRQSHDHRSSRGIHELIFRGLFDEP